MKIGVSNHVCHSDETGESPYGVSAARVHGCGAPFDDIFFFVLNLLRLVGEILVEVFEEQRRIGLSCRVLILKSKSECKVTPVSHLSWCRAKYLRLNLPSGP